MLFRSCKILFPMCMMLFPLCMMLFPSCMMLFPACMMLFTLFLKSIPQFKKFCPVFMDELAGWTKYFPPCMRPFQTFILVLPAWYPFTLIRYPYNIPLLYPPGKSLMHATCLCIFLYFFMPGLIHWLFHIRNHTSGIKKSKRTKYK